jgi:hypothetical protein
MERIFPIGRVKEPCFHDGHARDSNFRREPDFLPMKLLAIPVLIGCLFAGCATGPTYTDAENAGALEPKNDKGMVVIYNPPGSAPMGAQYTVYANDQRITDSLRRGTFITCDVDPGQLRLSSTAGSGNGLVDVLKSGPLSLADQKADRLTLAITKGHAYCVEVVPGMWHESLQPRPWNEAQGDIRDCVWLNADRR